MPTLEQIREGRAWLAAEVRDDISEAFDEADLSRRATVSNLIGIMPALNAALRRRGVNGAVTEIREDRDQQQLHVTVRGDEEAGDVVRRALNPLRAAHVEIVVTVQSDVEEPRMVYGAGTLQVGRTFGATRPTVFRGVYSTAIEIDLTASEVTELAQDIQSRLTPPIRRSRYAVIGADEDWL